MAIEVFAPAKINLTLHITGQRADGYHTLDSIVMFADIGDVVRFYPAPDMRLEIDGPFANGVPTDARNLVWKAVELAGATGHIHLTKNLPHGAGIGGGSSDAGAVLRALGSAQNGLTLGADVLVCAHGSAARMRGIGEKVAPLTLSPLHAVLVNSGVHVSTPQVFKALAIKENPPMPNVLPQMGVAEDLIGWLAEQRNDLQVPAIGSAPEIMDVLEELVALRGQRLVRMSGSGASCFALFETSNAAREAAVDLRAAHPEWWINACVFS